MVEQFGHKRLAYHCSYRYDVDVTLDSVPANSIIRVAHVVPDYYDISIRYIIATRSKDTYNSIEERRLVRFFLIDGVQVTALPDAEI